MTRRQYEGFTGWGKPDRRPKIRLWHVPAALTVRCWGLLILVIWGIWSSVAWLADKAF